MEWKPRLCKPDELDAVIDLASASFGLGMTANADFRKQVSLVAETDRTFVIDDNGTIAGTAGAYSLDVALPGGSLPMCGVTMVSVLSTHRRQGMLSTLMNAVIDQAIERGEPLAGLTASEASIYRRFGFGVATRTQRVTIQRDRSAELVDIRPPGRIRIIGEGEAAKLLPAVWERMWRSRVGEVKRAAKWWDVLAVDPEFERDGASPRFLVVHEDLEGTVDGFAAYRFKERDYDGDSWYELRVDEIAAVDDGAEAALVRFLLDVDLVKEVTWSDAPLDLPLRWRLADSRALTVSRERDWLWLRPLDIPACLTARTYSTQGHGGVIEVVDEARPELGGRFHLESGVDGAECRHSSADPDVELRIPDLGALLLGGVTWSELRRTGLVEERTAGAIDRLDALFRPQRAPYCTTGF